MGQRLNIEIMDSGMTLCNCYYHWSGYTQTALDITQKLVNLIQANPYARERDKKANI